MTVVIDTNTLLQCFSSTSRHYPIWQAIISEKFKVMVSIGIVFEYEEVLGRKASPVISKVIIDALLESPNVEFIEPDFKWNAIIADPDDDKFFDTAIAGNADFVVTNDKHFNVLKTISFPPVQIISSDNFLELITGL